MNIPSQEHQQTVTTAAESASANSGVAGAADGYVYRAAMSAARLPSDYTARVIPSCGGVAIPLENARILWQR